MLYAIHEAAYYASTPWRMAARATRDFWGSPVNPAAGTHFARTVTASADMFANLTRLYGKPDRRIDRIEMLHAGQIGLIRRLLGKAPLR